MKFTKGQLVTCLNSLTSKFPPPFKARVIKQIGSLVVVIHDYDWNENTNKIPKQKQIAWKENYVSL